MNPKDWLQALSIPKLITVLCLLGLGVNGLVQMGVQRDIAVKSEKLRAQVVEAQQLSDSMKSGLNGLTELKDTTLHMAGTVKQLQSATHDMHLGLVTLDQTVAGINQSVQTIGQSTQQSVSQIQTTEATARALLDFLQKISLANGQVIANLNQMMQDQQRINQNLDEMNRKTAILPRWGGN
ncbi:hypothetical protein [Effusibacillus pohliae]|uniref:hypothetical protein n=1 Tax=Effusibacillus pohliae TaxID=232270 RepID=UPI000375C077|nr:hypothetical protein [Effusibacillus pohliae]